MLCVLGIIVMYYAVLGLLTGFLFWYERLNGEASAIPQELPGLGACLRQYLRILWSYLLCFLTSVGRLFSRRSGCHDTSGPASAQPAILVHGLYCGATAWWYMARSFRKAGYRVFLYEYACFKTTPASVNQGLEECIRTVETQCGKRPFLVGHSLGGLVIRDWLRDPGNPARIAGVLTLGTPHEGSKLASLALGPMARAIRPQSEWIHALRAAENVIETPCVSLASPSDEAVLPSSHLVPPDGWTLRVTPPMGHFAMLFSSAAARMALEELRAMESAPIV